MANEKEKKVAIYIRVSTTYQIDKDSLPMQRKDLTAYSSLIIGTDNVEIFEDAGYSGKNTDRPAFQQMMHRVRKGEFTHVLVWKIDRISRNLLDFAEMFHELQKLHVTFVSKNEQFDTSTAMGEAMLKIILVFAELERNMTSERVTATMISRASSGIWNGGKVPYGYDYNKNLGVFTINEHEAIVCRLIKDTYLNTQSLIETARTVNSAGHRTRAGNSWSPTACWKICESPFYVGIYRYNRCKEDGKVRILKPENEWVLVSDHHPAIFTLEEHNEMASIRDKNARSAHEIGSAKKGIHPHPFKGLVYCGICGSRMNSLPARILTSGYQATSFQCPLRRKSRECKNTYTSDTVIGEFIINYIRNMIKAKSSFSSINSLEELQAYLLHGSTFKAVSSIEENDLADFYNLLGRYRSDESYTLSFGRPKKKVSSKDPEREALLKERARQGRALKRLQDLYMYSEDAMTEKDFITQKAVITSAINALDRKLGMTTDSGSFPMSDEDFMKMASHLLMSSYLQTKEYILYEKLVQVTSPEVLQEYISTIIDSIVVIGDRVCSITFRNGLSHHFIYKSS